MPALPDVPNVLKCAFEFDLIGSLRGGVRMYFQYSGGPPSAANLNTLSTDLADQFGSDLAGHMSEDLSLIAVTVTDLTSATSAEGSWSGSIAGVNAGPPVTVDTAMLMNCHISRRYRGGKPRTYWPFGIAGNLNSDSVTWTSAFITNVTTDWNTFLAAVLAFTGIGCTLTAHVNVSYYQGFASVEDPVTHRWRNIPTPRSGPVSPDLITGVTFRPEISQQKRRRTSVAA
jgi:hypothetical protein